MHDSGPASMVIGTGSGSGGAEFYFVQLVHRSSAGLFFQGGALPESSAPSRPLHGLSIVQRVLRGHASKAAAAGQLSSRAYPRVGWSCGQIDSRRSVAS